MLWHGAYIIEFIVVYWLATTTTTRRSKSNELFSLYNISLCIGSDSQQTDRQTSEAENECAMPMRLRCFIITL